jgi:hypothetical protein
MARCPKTAAEAWKRLDKRLTQEEKQQIVEADNMFDFHFGLGMWIRNYWIYGGEKENVASLLRDLGEQVEELDGEYIFIGDADMHSSTILEEYQKHLKGKR